MQRDKALSNFFDFLRFQAILKIITQKKLPFFSFTLKSKHDFSHLLVEFEAHSLQVSKSDKHSSLPVI